MSKLDTICKLNSVFYYVIVYYFLLKKEVKLLKTFNYGATKIKDPTSKKWESIPALKGESAYEIAVRLGTFSGSEEEWNRDIMTFSMMKISQTKRHMLQQLSNTMILKEPVKYTKQKYGNLQQIQQLFAKNF